MVRIIVAALVVTLSGVFSAMALENKGAADIIIKGGSRGVVHFPHHRHQDVLKDCRLCHTLFPQEPGSIERLKNEGKLVKKQIMKKLCINCHKFAKRTGRKAGPTTCSKCHLKKK